MSIGKGSFMSSRPLPSKHSLYVHSHKYAPIKARRVLPNLGTLDRLAVRIERWLRVRLRRFQADSSHKSLSGRFGLPYETEEVSAT